jgi:alkylation response protein AidB-like acyl-CoA dehydrogenase
MDVGYGAEYKEFHQGVRDFLSGAWPPSGADADLSRAEQVARFRARAIEAGYLARGIPRRYGGSEQPPDVLQAAIIREELRRAGAPGDPTGIGPSMLVPTLLEKGTEWQKEKFVAATMRGEIVWCQGYSEPGSGSDLASLQTRAELVGDEWRINGQKIWTSGAQRADYMFCLCRTEPEASKHAGISYLLLDMHQPGIDVRPLKQMNGESTFNEVFLDDVRAPADWIVGKRGEGWIVSRTTLVHERNSIGTAEQMLTFFNGLVQLAREQQSDGRPALEDPVVRERLAEIEGYVRAHQYSGYFQLTRAARGESPGILQMMNKLNGTNIGQAISKLAYELLGDGGLHDAGGRALNEAPRDPGGWVSQYMGSLGGAIAGGTANIQRNIIAERGLALPRDWAAQQSKRQVQT